MINITEVIQFQYPDALPPHPIDCNWEVSIDKRGPRITKWELDDPQPTIEELLAVAATPEFLAWKIGRASLVIDRDTGKTIDAAVHPFAGISEEIGILRDQLVHVLNALGLSPTADFARLNEIAIKEIEVARTKKEAL